MNGREALATNVSSQLLTKETTYRPTVNASDWKNRAKCWEIASWIVFDEVVIRVETLPGETVSILLTG